MKINLIQQNSNQSFKGTVYLNKANMTVFDLELIQKESKKIVELASKKIPDFTIEKKNGTNYRVAVRDNSTTVLAWYEVDTQNWNVSEY